MNLLDWIIRNLEMVELVTFLFFLGLALAIVIYLVYSKRILAKIKITSGKVNIPWGIGEFNFEVSEHERIIAWKLYVQLKSRKAALPFDEKYDLIEEVYNSFYELFKISRELLMELPLDDISRSNSLAELEMRVLNEGLRPHLTKWQACYRSWWVKELSKLENANLTPQEIQRKFPHYNDLVKDIKILNKQLNDYSEELLLIARGRN
jgi:hypothetical protein